MVAAAVKVAPGAGPPSPTLGHGPGWGCQCPGPGLSQSMGATNRRPGSLMPSSARGSRSFGEKLNFVGGEWGQRHGSSAQTCQICGLRSPNRSVSGSLSVGTGGGVHSSTEDLFGAPCLFPSSSSSSSRPLPVRAPARLPRCPSLSSPGPSACSGHLVFLAQTFKMVSPRFRNQIPALSHAAKGSLYLAAAFLSGLP